MLPVADVMLPTSEAAPAVAPATLLATRLAVSRRACVDRGDRKEEVGGRGAGTRSRGDSSMKSTTPAPSRHITHGQASGPLPPPSRRSHAHLRGL